MLDEGGINVIPKSGGSPDKEPKSGGEGRGSILKSRSGGMESPNSGANEITGGGEKQPA
jgi:hypothetical protein